MVTEFTLQNLPDADQRLEAILQAFGDLMFIVDEDGMILDQKSSSILQLDSRPSQMRYRKIQDLLPVEEAWKITEGLQDIRKKNRIVQVEYSIPTLEGNSWYESRLVPSSNRQAIVLIRDITKYKQSEAKIKTQLEQGVYE